MRRTGLFSILLLLFAGTTLAQSGGQLWVRAFEDRNGNGARDAGEPLLTRGIGVNLLNADGIIIASALLDNSPNAAQGLVGFQQLPAGEYSVVVTSSDYTATTSDTFTTMVNDTGVPPVVEFGAQPVAFVPTQSPEQLAQLAREGQMVQIALAGGGAVIVVVFMAIVGLVVYLAFWRSRLAAARAADARRTTGSMRAVRTTSTGSYPKVSK